jgi:hypothetical protein
MYQVFGRIICKTIVKVFEIWIMFIILRYKIFFKIIVLKKSIKSVFNYGKLSYVISKDAGVNPKGN